MVKKYAFTGEVKKLGIITLRQIVAVKDFGSIKAGTVGGWIDEKEENLSHNGNCWIYPNAYVFGNARVFENAQIHGYSTIYDNAHIFGNALISGEACVYGDAKVHDNAQICDHARIYDKALVYDNASISGRAYIFDSAKIYGHAKVSGNAQVYGDTKIYDKAYVSDYAEVSGNTQVFWVVPAGLQTTITFFICDDETIRVNCDNFNGDIEQAKKAIKIKYYQNSIYKKIHLATFEYAETILNLGKKAGGV